MNKSIVIIGKGPSVLKSTKEFVDSFDDVALINCPPMENYQHLISNRAKYLFQNCEDPYPYKISFMNQLGLTHIFNTASYKVPKPVDMEPWMQIIQPDNIRRNVFPDYPVEYDESYGRRIKKEYKEKFDLWPSSGIMALDYFCKSKTYTKIGLVGFDLHPQGSDIYYFPKHEAGQSLHGYYDGTIYTPGGKIVKDYDSEKGENHGGPKKQKKVIDMITKEKELVWL